MYLLISIILSIILGFILMMLGPIFGGIAAFGIVVGCIFRGLYLLNSIHKRLTDPDEKIDKLLKNMQ
ncbi:hypothetical protein P6709_06860 [Jeotgalibacillus sp. ET6]|uniref:hypothetical protein n=1 Tax=Jeotgalibacillus sp. ET6 TaxID=3037260 RepID=UPI0024187F1E|nr:hypothetical protein [Jeotgalibacillus sp. ET6]MDG5471462.1 hypothetical protein [Jeotgalibacillus sp. ET6]